MTRDSEDDALRWEGDDDPTLAPGWKAVGPAVSAPSRGAQDAGPEASAIDGAETADRAESPGGAATAVGAPGAADEEPVAQTGSVELVVLGILAGVYLLYTVGWLITALRTSTPGISIVSDFMYALGLWLAVLAAPCWFALALRAPGRRIRLAWLVAGVVLLAPLPFVLGVTA
jgi:hypothetical protein